MSDIQTLRQYLVGLGFNVNTTQLRQFQTALRSASKMVKDETGNIGVEVIKWQAKIVGMFAAVTGAVAATVDKVAQGDQEFRLFGERMFMSTERARNFKIAIDALGQSPGAIIFDPELFGRYKQLRKDQDTMTAGLGMDYESTMRQIRDVRFEFTRLRVEMQYLLMGTVEQLFKALGFGSGDLVHRLHQLNDYIIANMPRWSKIIANDLVPVLKDAWQIFKDLMEVVQDFASIFTNLIGLISGDQTLMGAANFDKFARSVDKVLRVVTLLFSILTKMQATLTGATIGSFFGPEGTLIGAGIGAGVDLFRNVYHATHPGNPLDSLDGSGSSPNRMAGAASIAAQARAAAASVGQRLGIDPAIIYAQWEHETGNFTNRGATQLNNLAGINVPGGTGQDYRSFASIGDFANYYASLIAHNYQSAVGAKTPAQFAQALKAGGYYADSVSNYTRGIKSHIGDYRRSGSVTIQTGDINIHGTNLTGQQIQDHVTRALTEKARSLNQRSMFELSPVVG